MVHLIRAMHWNWPTENAINHSSIGLSRLIMQLVFKEVWLFIFCKWTQGFDITVTKNYLKWILLKMMKRVDGSIQNRVWTKVKYLYTVSSFYQSKHSTIYIWCSIKNADLSVSYFGIKILANLLVVYKVLKLSLSQIWEKWSLPLISIQAWFIFMVKLLINWVVNAKISQMSDDIIFVKRLMTNL